MKTSKVKNIVLLILALANSFLVLLLLLRRAEQRNAYEDSTAQLAALFSGSGITIDASVLPKNAEITTAVTQRDPSAECAFAEALLGTADYIDSGGGVYRYENAQGFCQFRANGAVEAETRISEKQPLSFCRKLFEAYGYELTEDTVSGSTDVTGTITGIRCFEEIVVFNAQLCFRWEDGDLVGISGSFLPSVQGTAELPMSDAITPLVRLYDYRTESGDVFRRIRSVSCGCFLQSTASSPLQLIPMWRIETDVSAYYVDPNSGIVTRS